MTGKETTWTALSCYELEGHDDAGRWEALRNDARNLACIVFGMGVSWSLSSNNEPDGLTRVIIAIIGTHGAQVLVLGDVLAGSYQVRSITGTPNWD